MQKNFDIIRPKTIASREDAPSPRMWRPVNKRGKLIAVVIGALLVIGVAFALFHHFTNQTSAFIDTNKYQAIFLNNNQVYFGKLQRLDDGSYRLTDVFYINDQNNSGAATPGQTTEQAAQKSQSASPTLVKLGSELHGPEDQIIFNNSQVTFWENLKPDGKVSKAIADSQKK